MKILNLSIIVILVTSLLVLEMSLPIWADIGMIPSKANENFQLKINQTAYLKSENLEITLLNIQDSRCPSGVVCFWEGIARAWVNILQDNQDLGNFNLTSKNFQSGLGVLQIKNYMLELVDIEPYPQRGQNIELSDYSVTFMVTNPSMLPPLKQFKSGISLDDISCKDGFFLAISNEKNPLCLRPETISKLASRGFFYGVNSNEIETNYTTILIPPGSENQAANKTYSPNIVKVIIGVNNTIRWVNQADVGNSVAEDINDQNYGKTFNSSFLRPGQSYEFTFIQPGTYHYHGDPHPWQVGTVIVMQRPNGTTLPASFMPCDIAVSCPSSELYSQIGSLTGIGVKYIPYQ